MKPVYTMQEWETTHFPHTLTPDDRQLVERIGRELGRFNVDELREGVRITSRSWVGVITFEQFIVRIIPKLVGAYQGLVDLIGFTRGIDALRRERGVHALATDDSADLFDLIALLLAESAERIIQKGVVHDYVEIESELTVLRGHLRVSEQMRHQYGRIDRLECRYDEHLSDIRDNQLLAVALKISHLRGLHPAIAPRIDRLATLFQQISPTIPPIATLLQPFSYHRLNNYYADAHTLARLILQQEGVEDLLKIGRTPCFAFLIDMNLLFEQFVAKLLTQCLGREYTIETQVTTDSIIWDAEKQSSYTSIRPDILIKRGDETISADAKYKRYDQRQLTTSDIYQTFFYAFAFQTENVPKSLIFYPASAPESTPTRLQIRTYDGRAGGEIIAIPLDIPQLLGQSAEQLDAFRAMLVKLLCL